MTIATPTLQFLEDTYRWAKAFVCSQGFHDEIEWQLKRVPEKIDEAEFLRESAWVILSGGMRETVIRAKFPAISEVFFDWASAETIHRYSRRCRRLALRVFAHPGKINAILYLTHRTSVDGFQFVSEQIRLRGVDYLREFPYLGPATSFHLAKNLGLDVAKPDRHLLRIAAAVGAGSVDQLCRSVSQRVGDSVAVVDLVLWRFATLHRGYLGLFSTPDEFHF
jgi:hypothetical protein